MPRVTKIVLASIGTLLVFLVSFYGSFLPLRKSQILIHSLRSLNSAQSTEEFKKTLTTPLVFPSPIGQEEVVRNIANVVMNVVQQTDNPETIADMLNFIESYYKPIIARGVGMSFEQNLYILGVMNELAFVKTKQVKFLSAAHNYFEQGKRLGPKRPQFLYGLFDIYRIEGDVEGAKAVANQILEQWPTDSKIQPALDEFLKRVASATASNAKNNTKK